MKEDALQQLITKHLAGETSSQEQAMLSHRLENDPQAMQLFAEALTLHSEIASVLAPRGSKQATAKASKRWWGAGAAAAACLALAGWWVQTKLTPAGPETSHHRRPAPPAKLGPTDAANSIAKEFTVSKEDSRRVARLKIGFLRLYLSSRKSVEAKGVPLDDVCRQLIQKSLPPDAAKRYAEFTSELPLSFVAYNKEDQAAWPRVNFACFQCLNLASAFELLALQANCTLRITDEAIVFEEKAPFSRAIAQHSVYLPEGQNYLGLKMEPPPEPVILGKPLQLEDSPQTSSPQVILANLGLLKTAGSSATIDWSTRTLTLNSTGQDLRLLQAVMQHSKVPLISHDLKFFSFAESSGATVDSLFTEGQDTAVLTTNQAMEFIRQSLANKNVTSISYPRILSVAEQRTTISNLAGKDGAQRGVEFAVDNHLEGDWTKVGLTSTHYLDDGAGGTRVETIKPSLPDPQSETFDDEGEAEGSKSSFVSIPPGHGLIQRVRLDPNGSPSFMLFFSKLMSADGAEIPEMPAPEEVK